MLEPADENFGIKFQRVDLSSSGEQSTTIIPALLDNVVNTKRCTTISNDYGNRVMLVEHLLACFAGLQVDNCLVKISGYEVPIMDGSSEPFCRLVEEVGVIEQDAKREYITTNDDYQGLKISVNVDFISWSPAIGKQTFVMNDIKEFRKNVAPSRTFTLTDDNESIQMLKGLKPNENTILFERGSDRLPHLRFPDEVSRHKLLDVLGDMCLIGKPLRGSIVLTKPGHSRNIAYAKALISSQLRP